MCRTILAVLIALLPGLAAAHPHVFVDATLMLRFDREGRLEAVATTWTYDEFYTLYAIEALEMDADGDGALTDAELAEMARVHTEKDPAQDIFPSQLWLTSGGAPVALRLPSGATARIEADRLVIGFERVLEEPADPAPGLSLQVYDPSYFIAYTVVGNPLIYRLPSGCSANLRMFSPDAADTALLSELSALSAEETPMDANVGALLADDLRVTCD